MDRVTVQGLMSSLFGGQCTVSLLTDSAAHFMRCVWWRGGSICFKYLFL